MADPTIDDVIADAFDELTGPDEATNPPDGGSDEGQDDLEDDAPSEGDDDPDDDDPDEGLEPDDEADGEDDGDEGDGDSEAAPTQIEVGEGDVIVLADGTEIPVKDGALRHKDYTQKTQELARKTEEVEQAETQVVDAYNQLTSWYEARKQDPVAFAAEIIGTSQDQTLAVAKLLKSLAGQGVLDPKFVATFGIETGVVADKAGEADQSDRLAKLEQAQTEQREQAQASERQQQVVQHYLGKWDELKADEGLTFDSQVAERERFREVVKFAAEKQVTDLSVAYAALERAKGRQGQTGTAATPPPDPAAADRKRATRAMARKSKGTSASAVPAPTSDDEAASQAWDELMAGA